MDLSIFKSEFVRILDLLPDKRKTKFGYVTRGLELEWRNSGQPWVEATDGHLIILQLLHRAAPELMRETLTWLFETYKFTEVKQVTFLMTVVALFTLPGDTWRGERSNRIPDVNNWDPTLERTMLNCVLSEKNSSLTHLITITTNYSIRRRNQDDELWYGDHARTRLAEMMMYYFSKNDKEFRRYYLRLITRSKMEIKKRHPSRYKRVWEEVYGRFLMERLEVIESKSTNQESYFGKRFRKNFSDAECTAIAKQVVAHCKRNEPSYIRASLARVVTFHPLINDMYVSRVRKEIASWKEVPHKHTMSDLFCAASGISVADQRVIVADLYKKLSSMDNSTERVKEKFTELANEFSFCLGKANFQRLQVMYS